MKKKKKNHKTNRKSCRNGSLQTHQKGFEVQANDFLSRNKTAAGKKKILQSRVP